MAFLNRGHKIDPRTYACERCGKSVYDLEEDDSQVCEGYNRVNYTTKTVDFRGIRTGKTNYLFEEMKKKLLEGDTKDFERNGYRFKAGPDGSVICYRDDHDDFVEPVKYIMGIDWAVRPKNKKLLLLEDV